MRVDEAATYLFYVRKPPLYGLVSYTLPNNHVFHTLLVSVSTFLFGNDPWVIRLPAFFAGIAMIPLAYVVARNAHDEAAGLLAAAFVASSSVLIEYSSNARGYTIVAGVFLGLLALGPALLRGEARAWRWFTILSAIGFFTIPTMLFPFGIVVAWLALNMRQDGSWRLARGVGLTFVLTAIAYLPAILWTGPRAVFANRFVVSRPWSVWVSLIRSDQSATWRGWNRGLGLAGMVLFPAFFVIGLARDRTRLPFIAVAWCGLLVVAERWIVFPRVWTFLVPIYWMTVAGGIVFVLRPHRWVVPVALAACVAIGGSVLASGSVLRSPDDAFPDAERIAVTLSGLHPDDSVLAFNPATVPLQYYVVLHHETMRLNAPRPSDRRLFIVVDTAAGQTLDMVARVYAVPPDVVARATVLRRFPHSMLYLYTAPVP